MDLNNGILALSQYSNHLETCQTFLVDMLSIENGDDDIKVKKLEDQIIPFQTDEMLCVRKAVNINKWKSLKVSKLKVEILVNSGKNGIKFDGKNCLRGNNSI